VLDPDLAVSCAGVVLEQEERWLVHFFEVALQCREPGELELLVDPQADLGPLLVLEALLELADEASMIMGPFP
jgi:hypothetical protein